MKLTNKKMVLSFSEQLLRYTNSSNSKKPSYLCIVHSSLQNAFTED